MLAVLLVSVAACGEDKATTTTAATTGGGTETTAAPTETTAAPTETTASGEVYKLIWASGLQSNSPTYTDFIVKWAEWLTAKSGGRLQIEFQVDGSVLPPPEVLDGVANGVADMGDLFMGLYAGRFPLNEVVMLPLMFQYPTARCAGLTATELLKKYPALEEEFTNAGVKFLGFMPMGAGQIHTTEKPIKTAADLNGVVLEAHSGEYVSQALQLLGATPEQIEPAEGFDALAKGIVEGTVGEFEFIVSAGFSEVINYSTEIGSFGQGMEAVVMNIDAWNNLPADLQELLAGEAMTAYTEVMGAFMDEADKTARDTLDAQYKAAGHEGVYVLPPAELEAWKTLILPVWDSWVENAKALGAPAEEMLADAQAFAAQFAYGTYSLDFPQQMMQEWGMTQ
jgi:TRAP-type C4-dicarboxylate transport system substrate-binding protein